MDTMRANVLFGLTPRQVLLQSCTNCPIVRLLCQAADMGDDVWTETMTHWCVCHMCATKIDGTMLQT